MVPSPPRLLPSGKQEKVRVANDPKSDFPSSIVVLVLQPTSCTSTLSSMLPSPCIFGWAQRGAHGRLVGTGSGSRLTYGPAARRPARPSSSSFSSCPPHFSFPAFSRPRGLCGGARTVSDGRGGGSGPRFRFRHVATGFVRPSRALGNLRRQGRSADDEGPRDGEIRGRRPEISVRPWPSLVDLGSPPVVGLIYRLLLCSLWHRP